jgi:hypothetical protein
MLDVLREQRQKHKKLRMVFTGSIGLHHVFSDIQQADYAISAVNDMRLVEVPPLDREDAAELANRLLRGERLEHTEGASEKIADSVESVPYYIHHIVSSLADRGKRVTDASIEEAVTRALDDANDPWHLRHFKVRLRPYYGDRENLARAILTILAEEPLDLERLTDRLRATFQPKTDREKDTLDSGLGSFLELLERDHYLKRNEARAFAFRFDLIRRWWQLGRG